MHDERGMATIGTIDCKPHNDNQVVKFAAIVSTYQIVKREINLNCDISYLVFAILKSYNP